ncbi:hypothetical protein BCEN4_760030 [Burkholderia cenocepacia]|nr:hypothetical protein BCEN4_760030 [Burkholderia cenocepacia]
MKIDPDLPDQFVPDQRSSDPLSAIGLLLQVHGITLAGDSGRPQCRVDRGAIVGCGAAAT